MTIAFVVLFLLLLLGCLTLHVLGLPANWLLLGLVALWDYFHPAPHLGFAFYAMLVCVGLAGEAVELFAQVFGAKKYGATGKGNLGGFLGAFAGALLGAPFLLGLGALFGAVAGAFVGCYVFERAHGRAGAEARRAAMGAMYGKVFGMTAKVACGVVMWVATARALWPA
ncbi:DUF456 domain-containing protein [Solidesulfovibrio sp.]|uniref:DUF456 domain-containing protein n=1 Tax=Solidesulfovibrio sp. TaxID=2910990 RepID=UPI00262BAA69|nr:DUF456 domain-containing protein [Solidesulfovibrio sp.]